MREPMLNDHNWSDAKILLVARISYDPFQCGVCGCEDISLWRPYSGTVVFIGELVIRM